MAVERYAIPGLSPMTLREVDLLNRNLKTVGKCGEQPYLGIIKPVPGLYKEDVPLNGRRCSTYKKITEIPGTYKICTTAWTLPRLYLWFVSLYMLWLL